MLLEVDRPAGRTAVGTAAALVLVLATVGLQISYPLLNGENRDRSTLAIVVCFAAASLVQAGTSRGARGLGALVAVGAFAFAAELLGRHTGFPFGHYVYTGPLGPTAGGVPLVVAAAWLMMAWPAALVALRLGRRFSTRVLIGTWALAAWDLFLDPQMVHEGNWAWTAPGPGLPGVPSVPLTNLLGWILVSAAISLVLQGFLHGQGAESDQLLRGAYLWIYASSAVALLAFLHLPAAAVWGTLGMGAVAVPLAVRLRSDR